MNKRLGTRVLIAAAFLLPSILILIAVAKARFNRNREAVIFVQRAEDTFTKWERDHAARMAPVTSVDFNSCLSNITSSVSLSAQQTQKLQLAISGFYQCYAGGTFDGFRTYRLGLPFDLDTNVLASLRYCLPSNHRLAQEKTEQLEDLWKYYVSTNRILKVDPLSIKMTVEVATDRRQGIYFKATNYVAEVAVGYLPKAVVIHPTAKEISQRDKKVLIATVEQFVVTSSNPSSVDPLFVSFYWVEELGDWTLYEVARITGDFRIIY